MNIQLNNSFEAAALGREVAKHFCIRLTPSEKALLKERAGSLTLSEYIRRRTLGDAAVSRRRRRRPSHDEKALTRLLGALGQSHLSSNLNQIAKAANMGALPVTDELIAELTQACVDIRTMRRELITALGLKAED